MPPVTLESCLPLADSRSKHLSLQGSIASSLSIRSQIKHHLLWKVFPTHPSKAVPLSLFIKLLKYTLNLFLSDLLARLLIFHLFSHYSHQNVSFTRTEVLCLSHHCLSHHSQFSSVAHPGPTLCDPMDGSTPGFPFHHQFPELTQTPVHCEGDAIQPSHPLSAPGPPAFNLSQHQGVF